MSNELLQHSAWLIPLYPLLAFVLIVSLRWVNILKERHGSGIVIVTTVASLLHSALLLLTAKGHFAPFGETITWLQAGPLQLPMGYFVDAAGMMMLLVVTTVSLLIHIYTRGYMSEDPGYSRFYAYLALFNFSMLSLVLSSSLFQMYVFWEMVGVSSYLLIGFWFTKPSAAQAATKAFLMNRIGDFGLLIGILTLLFYSRDWLHGPVLMFSHMPQIAQAALGAAGPTVFTIIAVLLFMGPVAKSAQLPLHTWLPDAMEGPTPISALIHAATMVAAGVFLIARLYPVFTLSSTAMSVIAVVGVLTAFVAATIALTQVDIKKALAYSTMSQLGYMVMAMGLGAYTAGLFHLMTHAYFKAMLFLCSGSVIHGCHHEQDMRQMGGLKHKMPLTWLTYLIGTVAITGVLPFAGFWSKDEILATAYGQPLFFAVALLTAGMTSFYMFRTYFLTFEGEYRGHAHPHESPNVMTYPLLVLAVPSVLIGAVLAMGWGVPSFAKLIHFGEHHHEGFNYLVMGLSTSVAWLGLGLSWLMYGKKVIDPAKIAAAVRPLYTLSWNKWFFDDAYLGIAQKIYLPFADLSSWFDRTVIDGLVGLSARSVTYTGGVLRRIQTGSLQLYLVVLFVSISVLFIVLQLWV